VSCCVESDSPTHIVCHFSHPLPISYVPLHEAAKSRLLDVAQILIAAKADVNAVSTNSMYATTPLHQAAMLGHLDVAQMLIAAKANVNAVSTNIMYAI
jgi:ankyrin repeat protein